jgi:osomolarity two-component system, sensor histidine kinase NIK1
MWVETEVSKGSKLFFTITSQISQSSIENTLSKMSPFNKRAILFVDMLWDGTGVVDRIHELGLRPYVVHEVNEVADKDRCPHIDTIVVSVVRVSLHLAVWRFLTWSRRPNSYANLNICGTSPLCYSHR